MKKKAVRRFFRVRVKEIGLCGFIFFAVGCACGELIGIAIGDDSDRFMSLVSFLVGVFSIILVGVLFGYGGTLIDKILVKILRRFTNAPDSFKRHL
jgi:hypothetical protein